MEPPAALRRGTSILIAAMVTELVAIAGADNQWVTRQVQDWLAGSFRGYGVAQGFVISTQVFHWRFTPQAGDVEHLWAASLVTVAVTLLVTGLVLHALTRSGASAGRAFLSALLAVVVAGQLGVIAGGLVIKQPALLDAGTGGLISGSAGFGSRIANALFGVGGVSGASFIGSAMFGVLVGAAAAVAASRAGGRGDPRSARLSFPSQTPAVPPTPPAWIPQAGADEAGRATVGEGGEPIDGRHHVTD